MKTVPAPPQRPQEAMPVSWHLSRALLGEPGWDVRCGRLDPELDDLRALLDDEPPSRRAACPQ